MTDKALMTLMLYGECRGESQYGKLCVASTITKCARKFRYKTVGGYNWQYVSTSN